MCLHGIFFPAGNPWCILWLISVDVVVPFSVADFMDIEDETREILEEEGLEYAFVNFLETYAPKHATLFEIRSFSWKIGTNSGNLSSRRPNFDCTGRRRGRSRDEDRGGDQGAIWRQDRARD